jgi:probable addiction module antidote protein
MRKSRDYQRYLVESLKDADEALEYLNAALQDGDPRVFLLALRNVAEARGGMTQLSRRSKLNRESLYRMLSRTGNPELRSLGSLLDTLGFRLSVEAKEQARKVS